VAKSGMARIVNKGQKIVSNATKSASDAAEVVFKGIF
jgi:hypothetical protein